MLKYSNMFFSYIYNSTLLLWVAGEYEILKGPMQLHLDHANLENAKDESDLPSKTSCKSDRFFIPRLLSVTATPMRAGRKGKYFAKRSCATCYRKPTILCKFDRGLNPYPLYWSTFLLVLLEVRRVWMDEKGVRLHVLFRLWINNLIINLGHQRNNPGISFCAADKILNKLAIIACIT